MDMVQINLSQTLVENSSCHYVENISRLACAKKRQSLKNVN